MYRYTTLSHCSVLLLTMQDFMKRRRNCSLFQPQDFTHVGLNAHAQKKGCICNRLKFAMAAASFFSDSRSQQKSSALVQG